MDVGGYPCQRCATGRGFGFWERRLNFAPVADSHESFCDGVYLAPNPVHDELCLIGVAVTNRFTDGNDAVVGAANVEDIPVDVVHDCLHLVDARLNLLVISVGGCFNVCDGY